jgi:hypothetical protein
MTDHILTGQELADRIAEVNRINSTFDQNDLLSAAEVAALNAEATEWTRMSFFEESAEDRVFAKEQEALIVARLRAHWRVVIFSAERDMTPQMRRDIAAERAFESRF